LIVTLNQLIMKHLLLGANLHYPSAREWMWNYCIYLGPFTDSKKANYDLGIFLGDNDEPSLAIVYGNNPGEYISGDINHNSTKESHQETIKRAKLLNLL